MSDDPRLTAIDHYLEQLDKQLKDVALIDREEILLELRSHFDDKLAREPYLVAEELFRGFGTPEGCARGFLQHLPTGTPGWPFRRLLTVVPFYLFLALLLGSALLKLIFPQRVGLWVGDDHLGLYLLSVTMLEGHDVFGYWLVPMSLVFGLGLYWLKHFKRIPG